MQAHSAPLGIAFYAYDGARTADCAGAFPEAMDGDAFVAFHGSWNRDVPTGYKVVRVPFDRGAPTGAVEDVLAHAGDGAKWPSGFRPVDARFDACGRLVVSSDGTRAGGVYSEGAVVRVCHGPCDAPTAAPTAPANGGGGARGRPVLLPVLAASLAAAAVAGALLAAARVRVARARGEAASKSAPESAAG